MFQRMAASTFQPAPDFSISKEAACGAASPAAAGESGLTARVGTGEKPLPYGRSSVQTADSTEPGAPAGGRKHFRHGLLTGGLSARRIVWMEEALCPSRQDSNPT